MPVAYHVDRSNQLDAGDVLELEDELVINPQQKVILANEEQESLNKRYPEGLSWHGVRYASVEIGSQPEISINGKAEPLTGVFQLENRETGERSMKSREPISALYEWLFELIRRSEFPDRQSRFQSFFGFETMEAATNFAADTNAQIVEVKYDHGFSADMDLLLCESYANALHQATEYWKGEPSSENPTWEILIQPPVEVTSIISD